MSMHQIIISDFDWRRWTSGLAYVTADQGVSSLILGSIQKFYFVFLIA